MHRRAPTHQLLLSCVQGRSAATGSGLSFPSCADFYGISSSLDEAQAYLQPATVGPRLVECTEAFLALEDQSLPSIFGLPDDRKFWSSMTLFSMAAGQSASVYARTLDRFFDGHRDPGTLALLGLPGSDRGEGTPKSPHRS